MGLLTKQDILNADDLKTVDIVCEEWGGTVRVKPLTGTLRDVFEAGLVLREGTKTRTNMVNIRARLIALCMVDDAGARVWNESEIALLGGKSAAPLDRIFAVCQKISGLTQADVEDLAKNSSPGLNGSSPSTSASPWDAPTPTSSSGA